MACTDTGETAACGVGSKVENRNLSRSLGKDCEWRLK
ncbi:predicted protein [Sclerotinia sclerotiorum 1980 UF-70]|uniref:Uncharacterized protein n=1 Tax=Sclerotinia sclerotiorum (strain ATCC 18683 / 1980 / Ss-1) TaxID=665079 RepID=A7ECS5_SCLS1|nr:predicted protein [Sclerotinia sclerotiorum 1980 UF-70]EDO00641.1 predicted protein [Sclerotinia sclerotiorum 1980 UF-70]